MLGLTVCPGCGVALPASDWPVDRRLNASAACWQVANEVTSYELSHPDLAGPLHQLNVDTYGAQHAGGPTPPIRVAYSLVGLHLALDRGLQGVQVRAAHQQMGRPDPSWPAFAPPSAPGTVTVLDVAAAGARAGSVAGQAEAMQRWAQSVWQAWAPEHAAVAALTDRLLGDWPRRR